MSKFRNKIDDKIVIFDDKAFVLLKILADLPTGKTKKLRINEEIITIKNENKIKKNIDYFDFAIVCAVLTLFETIGINKKFNVLSILKIVSGNFNARFSKNPKKQGTFSKKIFDEIIEYFNNISVFSKNNQYKSLFSLEYNEDGYSFIDTPVINELFKMINANNKYYPLEVINLNKCSIHSTHENMLKINFKYYILSKIISIHDKCVIDKDEIKDMLKYNVLENKAKNDLYRKKISKDIFVKRLKNNQRKFESYIFEFFTNLKKHKIINQFTIKKEVVVIR